MADLLIKGLEMPKGDLALWISVHKDGTVEYIDSNKYEGYKTLRNAAVTVPPHGDLIERGEIMNHRFVGIVGECEKSGYMVGWNTALEAIYENAETVIPASEVENG